MLTISNKVSHIAEAVKSRLMIFIFLYLTFQFSLLFIMASVSTHPLMAMWGNIFFEMTAIIIFNLLFGASGVGRDVITLTFYGVLVHLLYIPFYCYGIDLSSEHNNAQKIINALIVLRLLLPFSQDLLRRIALLEYAKGWFHVNRLFVSQYVNGLTISIFILCALPLFTMIYFINTDQMRMTGIAIVLFAFFIAIESTKKAQQSAEQAKPSTRETTAENTTDSKSPAQENADHTRGFVMLLIACFAAFVAFNLWPSDSQQDRMYKTGYASGYQDGKNGVKPKSSVRLGKMLYCHLVFDPTEQRDYGKGPHECDPEHFDK